MQTVARKKTVAPQDSAPALDLAQRFREYYPRLYNYLRYRLSSLQEVEDIIDTVFERAYSRRGQFDPTRGTFAAWLFRIAQNELTNHFRQHQRRSAWETGAEIPLDLAAPMASPETQIVHQEQLVQLLQGLAQLGERDQEIISLKFASKLSNKEIGEIMEMKEKTVSVVLLRAVRRLREQVEKEVTA